MKDKILTTGFFDQPAPKLAIDLLGKVLRHKVTLPSGNSVWLAARIIETEAYEISEKGSDSSLGFTEKRRAMFMSPGTIYMYYARGRDSLNFSARGEGNAVLIKSGYPHIDTLSPNDTIATMQSLNPATNGNRTPQKLCSGQTLLCRSLNLKVVDWNQQTMKSGRFRLEDVGYRPDKVVQCPRLGIPVGRDHELTRRYVDYDFAKYCTSNPLSKLNWQLNRDYFILNVQV